MGPWHPLGLFHLGWAAKGGDRVVLVQILKLEMSFSCHIFILIINHENSTFLINV